MGDHGTVMALNLRGTTVIVASHDMMVIHRVGNGLVTLEMGLIASDETRSRPMLYRISFLVGEAIIALRRNYTMTFAASSRSLFRCI